MSNTAVPFPRIALLHAMAESQEPCRAAFARRWPEAQTYNLLDDSLARDLADDGSLTPGMISRFRRLGHYAAESGADGINTEAILFTCNAFGPAIDQVKCDLSIPVLKPNEAAFERALEIGPRIGLLATFPSAIPSIVPELRAMAGSMRIAATIETRLAAGALDALRNGHPEDHDRLIAEAAASLPKVDAIILSQFSMARAADLVASRTGRVILTTPDTAVDKLRRLVEAKRRAGGTIRR